MNNEDDLKQEFDEAAARLDGIDVPVPEFAYFKDLVAAQQNAIRRRQRRELAMFIAVAAVLAAGILACLDRSVVLFLAFQSAVLLGSVIGLVWFFALRRVPKEGAPQ